MWTFTSPAAGRRLVRRFIAAVAVAWCVALPGAPVGTAADPVPPPDVTVLEAHGVYTVTARFQVYRPAAVALAVLSDYEQIPRFMPDVRKSVVLERAAGRMVVEQEAVSKLMMFSKRVHLLLDIEEGPAGLTFRDRCGKSFKSYEGSWTIQENATGSYVTYRLTAEPAFEVPDFILRRLLKRDSGEMIERLRREIAGRPAIVRPPLAT